MNYNKKSVEDIDVAGKRVLCRCDFNVPTKDGRITSDKRIVAALPTIQYLVKHGARVILCSHMGKPKGEVKPELSLQVVAERLSELLGQPVKMAKDVVGESAQSLAASLKDGEVMLLENTRFEKGETKNDPELSKKLASMADVFVNDAFGTAHRAHASTVCRDSRRREGLRQAERHQQPAREGRYPHHRRRHGLYLRRGQGLRHRQEPV